MYLSYFIIGYLPVFCKNVNICEFNFVRLQGLTQMFACGCFWGKKLMFLIVVWQKFSQS